jgi:hypothetical protein
MPKDETEVKPATKSKAEELMERHDALLGGRANMESYWQSLHDYYYLESQDINRSYYPGTELDPQYLWDSTTLECADVFASGFMNYLTPPSSKWQNLRPRNPKIAENKKVLNFLADVSAEVNLTLNRSNFYDQMFPSYKSSGVYGTSLLFEEEDIKDGARFYNMPLKQVVFTEDAKGRATEFYLDFEYSARQAANRWGVEALATEMQEEIKANRDQKKHSFVLYISTRDIREVQKQDKKNLPIQALWIDKKNKKIVEESGYHEMPAMVHRFDKRPFLPWGFSPAMKALPFARLLNAVAKTNLRAMMKHTDPPVALPSNAFILPFNQNPRAVNYYKKDSMDKNSVFAFANQGDPQIGLNAVEYYSNKVKTLMFHDTFLGFSGITKGMNNPEVYERINEKMTMLGPAVGRYLAEVLNPIVQRTIGILLRKGRLPEIPDEMLEDPGYEIDFVGSLAQAQRRSELNTLITGLTMVGNMAQYSPDVLDKLNVDKVTDEVWAITGAPVKVLRDDAEVQKIREGRAEEQLQAQQMQTAMMAAKAGADAGKAAQGFKAAEETNQ